jgi:hypothetical protein
MYDVRYFYIAIGSDLTQNDYQPHGHSDFAGDPAKGVLFHYGIEHGVGNLVTELVRMSFGNRLRGEKVTRLLIKAIRHLFSL